MTRRTAQSALRRLDGFGHRCVRRVCSIRPTAPYGSSSLGNQAPANRSEVWWFRTEVTALREHPHPRVLHAWRGLAYRSFSCSAIEPRAVSGQSSGPTASASHAPELAVRAAIASWSVTG